MRSNVILGTLVIGAFLAQPASAYDTLKQDMGTCLQGSGKASNEQIVAACSRMIDNAKAENEIVGFAYAMRAVAGSDKAAKCNDAKKASQLVKVPTIVEGSKQIIKSNC